MGLASELISPEMIRDMPIKDTLLPRHQGSSNNLAGCEPDASA